MTEAKPKPAAKPRAKPGLDAARLRRLAALIEELKATRLADLVHRLETEEGAKIADKGPAAGWAVNLAGIRATGTSGQHGALSNWANAARRAANAAEAA